MSAANTSFYNRGKAFIEDGGHQNAAKVYAATYDKSDGYITSDVAFSDNSSTGPNLGWGFYAPSFAVCKSRPDKSRFIYVLTPVRVGNAAKTRLYKHTINANGTISSPAFSGFLAEFDGKLETSEMDLSHDGQYLAFARSNQQFFPTGTDLVVIRLNTTTGNLFTTSPPSVSVYNLPDATTSGGAGDDKYSGVEFHPTNTNILYFGKVNEGIRRLDISNGTNTFVFGSLDYGASQIELTYYQTGTSNVYISALRQSGSTYTLAYINGSNAMQTYSAPGISVSYSFLNPFPQVNGIFTLQDQVDGEDYSIWSNKDNSSACCTRFFVPDDDNGYTPPGSGNLTWNPGSGLNPFNSTGTIVFRGDFVVTAGQNLTINNMTLRFHPGSKVIVQPNAKLYLNNTKLTGLDCNSTWDGVRLYGNRSLTQTYANQGFLSAYNLSEISHANVGLATWNLESGDINTSGGWAICNDVNFRNNKKDLDMISYPNANQAAFYRCNFTINDSYRFGTVLDHRVQLAQVSNLKFHGCTFANDCTQPAMQAFNVNSKAGIYSFDAGFEVNQNGTIKSTFRSLYQGINANRLFANMPFTATNAVFTQNQMAILTNVSNCVITSSTFNVGNNPNFLTNTGVFINTGIGFTIRDNTFTGFGNTINTQPQSFGTVVKNTCTATTSANTSIFRNTFTNLCYANQSEGRNRDVSDNGPGLVYFCNTHSNDLVDIRALRDPALGNVTNQGVRMNHFTGTGTPISVQNTFSQNAASGLTYPWYDFYLDNSTYIQNNITYRYMGNVNYVPQSGVSSTTPFQSPQIPLVPYVNYNTPGNAKTCSNNDPFQFRTIGELLSDNGFGGVSYQESKQNYLNAKYLYSQLIDNGDKDAIKRNIDYQWSDNAWELRNELLAKSPNLSEDVILHAANKNILSDALFFEVCAANPHLAKSTKFISQIENGIPNPLPPYMIEMLLNGNDPISYRKTLENQLTTYHGEMSAAYQAIISYLLQEPVKRDDVIVSLLEDVPLKEAKLDLAEYQNAKGDFYAATSTLNSFSALSVEEGKDPSVITEFMNFIFSKHNDITAFNTNDINYLQAIADDSSHVFHVRANLILKTLGTKEYDVQPLQLTADVFKTDPSELRRDQPDQSKDAKVKIYPNPAREYISFEYQYFVNASELSAEVIDNTGKVIFKLPLELSKNNKGVKNIPLSEVSNGTYFLTLKDGSRILTQSSFTKSE